MDYVAATTPSLSQIGVTWWDFTLFWPWTWLNDLDTRTWSEDSG